MKNARWVRLADDLTRGITNGDYPLDSYLPTEMELCEKYNVSRYTVRLALADLTRMGLIKRWPRLGSKVVSVGFDETYAHTYTSFADIDGLSSTHKRVVQGTQECVVDHALAKRLESGDNKNYNYLVSYESPLDGGVNLWHCGEIPFVFHNVDLVAGSYGGSQDAYDLQDVMASAWVNFATTGDPNGDKVPAWSAYTDDNKSTMVFDTTSGERVDYDAELQELISQ